LAISFALPTFAQQTNTPDPHLREKLIAAIKKHTDALDKNDAAAVAANFTEDGILVTPDGPIFGRESIEKYYVGLFKQIQLSNNLAPVDDDSPHIIGTAGNEMWATGRYSATVKGQNFGPVEAKGYWSVIREGNDWNIRMLCFNSTPAPVANRPRRPPRAANSLLICALRDYNPVGLRQQKRLNNALVIAPECLNGGFRLDVVSTRTSWVCVFCESQAGKAL
jgi:uncharacterized protein (TIGR02246 family)